MHNRNLGTALLLAVGLAACSADEILTVQPETVVDADVAITDAVSARSAVAGLYDALQGGGYYGVNYPAFADLSSDNAFHSGTFSTYATADRHQIVADNTTIAAIWSQIYRSIARANDLIERLPQADFVDAATRDQYLAEAYFIRALGYHNLVRVFGDVPLTIAPIRSADEAGSVIRSSSAQVYAQIVSDLAAAEQRSQDDASTTRVSLGAIRALRARVHLYRADYPAAELAANSVIAMGYRLAASYASLFSATGNATPEDIFRVAFSDQDANAISYYYMSKSAGGRRELAPTGNIRNAYEAGDVRKDASIAVDSRGRAYAIKFPSVVGTDHIHVIRFAEVLLIKAEAQARQGRIAEAILTLNPVRVRAGLAPISALAAALMTQQQVIDLILRERRLELAFEGDRWPDLIRTGLATSVENTTQTLYPIPQRERDVATGLTQNPGY